MHIYLTGNKVRIEVLHSPMPANPRPITLAVDRTSSRRRWWIVMPGREFDPVKALHTAAPVVAE